MRVVGIDPGSISTGYGVVVQQNQRLFYVASGTISTVAREPLPRRLKKIYDELLKVLQIYKPSAVVVENTFVAKNNQSALKLGQARGVALLAAEQCGLPLYESTPTEIKLAVVGYGRAQKDQVKTMVCRLLNLKTPPDSEHAADALAVAICHIHTAKIRALSSAFPAPKMPASFRARS